MLDKVDKGTKKKLLTDMLEGALWLAEVSEAFQITKEEFINWTAKVYPA